MSDEHLLLADLSNLLEGVTPLAVSDPTGVWDTLLKAIKELVQKIIDSANTSLRGVINTSASWVRDKINLARDAVQTTVNSAATGIRTYVGNVVTGLGTTLNTVSIGIKTHVTNAITGVSSTLGNAINGVKGVINSTVSNAQQALNSAIGGVKNTLNTGISFLKTEIGNVTQDVLSGVDTLLGGIGTAIENSVGWLVDKLEGVITEIRNIGTSIGNSIRAALENIGRFIGEAIGAAFEGASQFVNDAIQGVKNFIQNLQLNLNKVIGDVIMGVREWLGDLILGLKKVFADALLAVKEAFVRVRETVEDKIQAALDFLGKIRDEVIQLFWKTAAAVGDFLAKEVLPRFNNAVEGAQTLLALGGKLWDMIEAGNYEGAFSLLDEFARGLGIPAPVETLHAILSAIAYFWFSIRVQFIPLEVAAQKNAIIALALEPVSLEQAASAVFRGEASKDEFFSNAHVAGIARSRAEMVFEASKALPTPGAVQEAFLRGEIGENEHDKLLASYGYSDQNIRLFKALYLLIPPPTDLIRMAVREAFSPEIAERFGQFEDFPEEFAEWSVKQGISKEWAERYWAAHWDLPSPQMGFEMLHRGVIDENELKLLMRALDVMPYWRERLIEISYNPLTRVDVRRMYQFGVLTAEQVYRSYLDLGYSPEKAGWLTEFTKRYAAPEDASEQSEFRTMARTVYSQAYKRNIIGQAEYRDFLGTLNYHPDDITLLVQIDDWAKLQTEKLFDLNDYRKDWQKLVLQAYDRGLVTKDECMSILSDLGYEDSETLLEISLVDYNRELKLRNILVNQIKEQYVTFIIDITGVHELLGMFNFTANEIDRLQEEWDLERNLRTRHPTLTDLRRFFDEGLLTLEQFLDELRGLGYNEKYIGMYQGLLA